MTTRRTSKYLNHKSLGRFVLAEQFDEYSEMEVKDIKRVAISIRY